MENARNRDPHSRPCTSAQTTKHPIESRGIPPSESSASSVKLSSRFYLPVSSRRVPADPGSGGAPCCRIARFERDRNDNQSSSLPRDEKEQIAGESLSRMRPNAATVGRRDPPACSCFLQRRCEKATETNTPSLIDRTREFAKARVPQEPALPATAVSKKTFGRCYASRENKTNELNTESTIQFYKTNDKAQSQDSTALAASESDRTAKELPSRVFTNDLTPKEIMNTWVPGKEGPPERLFTPSENYIDVSTRDFSLRKYFPEMFLSETEKNEIRAREQRKSQERDAATPTNYCKNQKCPQGKCNSEKDGSDQDWRTIVERGSEIRTPCPWNDERTSLAQAQEEATDEDSNVKLTPEKRPRGWFRWPCGKSKRDGKKTEKKRHDEQQY